MPASVVVGGESTCAGEGEMVCIVGVRVGGVRPIITIITDVSQGDIT